jgi:hypothetical protein
MNYDDDVDQEHQREVHMSDLMINTRINCGGALEDPASYPTECFGQGGQGSVS